MFMRHATFACLLAVCGGVVCHAATIDSGLYTTYTTDNNKTELDWVVCGSIGTGSGCYSSGQLTPFGKIGSVAESSKVYDDSAGTVTRSLYVIDQASGSNQTGVTLYAYKRVDTIVSSFDTTTFTLVKKVSLPLTGSISATVFLGANATTLMVGTSLTTVPVEIAKKNFAITPMGIISQVPTSITADNYGFITVTSADGFFVVGPTGALQEDGGGSPSTVNTILGIQP
jgi:hypothetical protein